MSQATLFQTLSKTERRFIRSYGRSIFNQACLELKRDAPPQWIASYFNIALEDIHSLRLYTITKPQ